VRDYLCAYVDDHTHTYMYACQKRFKCVVLCCFVLCVVWSVWSEKSYRYRCVWIRVCVENCPPHTHMWGQKILCEGMLVRGLLFYFSHTSTKEKRKENRKNNTKLVCGTGRGLRSWRPEIFTRVQWAYNVWSCTKCELEQRAYAHGRPADKREEALVAND
jgi:hypothetical protein